ncbi:hypothetical protein BVRB_1g020760 [Beta vulgaris subsp. vulgaris]|uniref:Uncharacterized protein n=1 Tax=Beta vulgaris subsp. vulgaris TaxID=3555 RepID=A0A0J8BI64_BETVV|nr:hypothetical protein BVRB_1g020760 [Beta vulgaris subsp. vulgaris]
MKRKPQTPTFFSLSLSCPARHSTDERSSDLPPLYEFCISLEFSYLAGVLSSTESRDSVAVCFSLLLRSVRDHVVVVVVACVTTG